MEVSIKITLSKIGAFIVILGGLTYGLINKESAVVISAFTIGAGMLGWKQHTDAKIKGYESK